MAIIERIEELAAAGKITRFMEKSLKNNAADLERIAKSALANGGRLGVDDEAKFVKYYRDYAEAALRERKEFKALNLTEQVKVNAEIRDNFFNGVLGGLAKTNEEAALFRTALMRRALQPSGPEVTLLNGMGKLSKTEYEGLRTVTPENAKFFDAPMAAKWKLVHDNEAAIQAQRMPAAIRAGQRDGAAAEAQQTARTQRAENRSSEQARLAQEAAERAAAARAASAAIEGADDGRLMIMDALAINRTANFRMDTNKVFGQLRELLKSEHKVLLQNGPVDRGANVPALLSPKMVYDELRAGRPVSRDELNTLESFYRKHFDTTISAEEAAKKAAAATPTPAMVGALPGTRGVQMASYAMNFMTNGVSRWFSPNREMRNIAFEWENGFAPGIVRSVTNNLRDGRSTTWAAVSSIAIATAFAGNFINIRQNPEGTTPGLHSWAFGLAFDRDDNTIFEKMDPLINRQYDRLTKYPESSLELFKEYTRLITGIDIANNGSTSIDKETLLKISTALRDNSRGVTDPKLNPNAAELAKRLSPERDIPAYIYALATYSGIDVKDFDKFAASDKDSKGLIAALVEYNKSASINATASKYVLGGKDGHITKEFADATYQFTGKQLTVDKDKGIVTDNLTPAVLYDIASKLQSRGASNTNSREVQGYMQALASIALMPQDQIDKMAKGEGGEKGAATFLDKLTEFTRDSYIRSIANSMFNNPNDRNSRFETFYGRSDLSQTEQIRGFVDSTNADPILRGAIGEYLVMQGFIKREQLSVEGLKGLKASLTEQEAKLEGAVRDTVEADASRTSTQTADQISDERLRRYNQGGGRPASTSATEGDKRSRVTGMFNKMAADEDFPELKGKGKSLVEIYSKARDAKEFEQEVAKQVPNIPQPTMQMLRELAYGR